MILSEVTSVAGLTFGVAGFVLGVLNYLRDRHKIIVTLQWDLTVTPGPAYDAGKRWGVVRVTNVGRRSTYISHVALELPEGLESSHLLLSEGIQGKKLSEGDPTAVFMIDQEGMEEYAPHWQLIVAQVSDSTGKVWSSKRLKAKEKPSWASSQA